MSVRHVLEQLRDAGLQMIPGGGAEIFAPEVRNKIAKGKATGAQYLEVHRIAHEMGIPTNATMLYGHIETFEHRADHLLALRTLQDEHAGLLAFIPLAFHPENNSLRELPGTTAVDDLRTIAVSRLVLDNIAHIKSFWVSSTPKVAQMALLFGADDVDGTIVSETIYAEAGKKSPDGMSVEELCRLIREAGMIAIERDAFYKELHEHPAGAPEHRYSLNERRKGVHLRTLE
jgi:aminodeoxyfutalosine synthase